MFSSLSKYCNTHLDGEIIGGTLRRERNQGDSDICTLHCQELGVEKVGGNEARRQHGTPDLFKSILFYAQLFHFTYTSMQDPPPQQFSSPGRHIPYNLDSG
ncbi:hypothetical protein PM082_015476 [Marasmius tenuissimus]|nr:hypothetical protein PM082_015476 [Marasmius tenuissimus]